jgi:bifunctional non-homologous end joining protein LigD
MPGELPGSSADLFKAACQMGLEGIVSKRLDAPYLGGPNRPMTWLKVKCRPAQEVVIGGWKTEGSRFRSLMSGVWEGEEFRYTGSIHTGYSADVVGELMPRLKALETPKSPFTAGDPPRKTCDIHWVRPELVARVEFAEWTAGGKLRQASYKGLREDKPAAEVVEEDPEPPPPVQVIRSPRRRAVVSRSHAVEVLGVPIEHADKVLWPAYGGEPAITKLDLARYYAAVAEWLVPYVRGRPCTVFLAPDGVDSSTAVYQRHEGQRRGGLRDSPLVTHTTVASKGKTYPQFDNAKALVAAVQSAAVELHPWNSVEGEPDLPGRIVFDLDPDEGTDWSEVVRAALEVDQRLLSHGLIGYVKTSGGKGLHVVCPIAQPSHRPTTWAEVKAFAERLCEAMVADSPDRYTLKLLKADRGGRIFLDYLRNDPGRHAVALLSPRATPQATVSMPVSWTALRDGLSPKAFTVRNAARLMREHDPWKYFAQSARPLG